MDNTRNRDEKKEIIFCVPGLGGHPSVFNGYAKLLPNYELRYIKIVNPREAFGKMKVAAERENKVIFLCSCYGIQLALQVIETTPRIDARLIVIEPFFAEYHWWRLIAVTINAGLIKLMKFTDQIGLRRKKFLTNIDYSKLGRYPIFIQPIFDMSWHNLTDYFVKLEDVLVFKLPKKVEVKTLFILSPKGFIQSPKVKKRLMEIFVNANIAEVQKSGHNIITNSQKLVAALIREWLTKKNNL